MNPLAGIKVLICRPEHQCHTLAKQLETLGAEVLCAPVIATVPPIDGGAALRRAVNKLAWGDWLVLTSSNGVNCVASVMTSPLPEGVRVATIGKGTATSALDVGLPVHLTPQRSIAEGLLEEFPAAPQQLSNVDHTISHTTTLQNASDTTSHTTTLQNASQNDTLQNASDTTALQNASDTTSHTTTPRTERYPRVILARAAVARSVLPVGLRKAGWDVLDIPAYRTVPVHLTSDQKQAACNVNITLFTSSSTVNRLVAEIGARSVSGVIASIGPATTATANKHGLRVDVQADEHNLRGVISALCGYIEQRNVNANRTATSGGFRSPRRGNGNFNRTVVPTER